MVDVMKVFIRTERHADHNGHLSCIVTKMIHIFAAAGHHHYVKGARLYCQLMKELETLPACKDTLQRLTAHWNHVVLYSSHEWSGTWCDMCIEQTLMKPATSQGGLSRGRMRNSFSGHKCWVFTLSHLSDVNQRMEEDVSKHFPVHRELAKLGRQSMTSTIDIKSNIKSLSSLRKSPLVNEKKMQLDPLKLFYRLIIFSQRDMTVETSLQYELTHFPSSLFSNKYQKMNIANQADFSKTILKALTDPLDLINQPCSTLVIDGGWLLYMVKWEQHQTWQEIANSYLSYVKYLGRCSQKIIVVFDGYNRSTKDHDHILRTKNSCCNLQIRPDMFNWTPRAKFLDSTHNKSELIRLLSSPFQKPHITVEQCDNYANTSIVKEALAAASDCSVEVSTICVCS